MRAKTAGESLMIYLDLLSVQFPMWLKGHDSSFIIHTKHALFKEKKRGKERKEEEEEIYFEIFIRSSLFTYS